MADSLKKKQPSAKPYAWGYFHGVGGLVAGILFSLLFFYLASVSYGANVPMFIAYGIWALATAVFSYLIIRRNKWGWIVGTIISANPVLWIINAFYAKRRWSEFTWGSVSWPKVGISWQNPVHRAMVSGSLLWAVLVLTFVYLFEPYGRYMSNNEWVHVLKIIVFFPGAIWASYFVYTKVVRS